MLWRRVDGEEMRNREGFAWAMMSGLVGTSMTDILSRTTARDEKSRCGWEWEDEDGDGGRTAGVMKDGGVGCIYI